jgi:hypothetical protein
MTENEPTKPAQPKVRLVRKNPSTVVIETPKYWLLFSYETLIAYDDKTTNIISFVTKDRSGKPFGNTGNTTLKALNWFLGNKWQKAVMNGTAKEVTPDELEAML